MEINIGNLKSVDQLKWSAGKGKFNGFRDKSDLVETLKNPINGLRAIQLVMENCEIIHFCPKDILQLSIEMSEWFFSDIGDKKDSLKCSAGRGTMLQIDSEADSDDRFIEGQPDLFVRSKNHPGEYELIPLFERLLKATDIAEIRLIYDENYWETCSKYQGAGKIKSTPERYICILVPWGHDSSKPWSDNNPNQKSTEDEDGNLVIEWFENIDSNIQGEK